MIRIVGRHHWIKKFVPTVSRVLEGDPRISRETRDRIMTIAQEQRYTPNVIARSLVTRSSGVMGIVPNR